MKLVKVEKQNVVTSSRIIADKFGKDHKNVIRDIEVLINRGNTLKSRSSNLSAQMFAETTYKSRGKNIKEYAVSEKGCMLLIMGFSGDAAYLMKMEFIAAFDSMRNQLKSRNTARLENPQMTKAIQMQKLEAGKEIKPYHYSNENNLVYLVVLGATASRYKKSLDMDKDDNLRDELTPLQIDAVEKIQKMNTTLIDLGLDYHERKERLNEFYERRLGEEIRLEFSRIEG